MAQVTITEEGQVVYRTKLVHDEARARRFAGCLAANARFAGVEVVRSRRPGKKGVGWFVRFRPADAARVAALRKEQSRAREARADAEGPGYRFVWDEGTGRYWCWSPSGEVYETCEEECTCPDFVYRCRAAGISCKHQIALRQHQQESLVA